MAVDRNELAAFLNETGYNDAEHILNLDADLLQKAVAGEDLTRYESALIDSAMAGLELEDTNFVNFNELAERAELLNDIDKFIGDVELADSFRESVSFGQIDLEDLELARGLFANLTENQASDIIDWLADNPNNDAKEFLTAYAHDIEYEDF